MRSCARGLEWPSARVSLVGVALDPARHRVPATTMRATDGFASRRHEADIVRLVAASSGSGRLSSPATSSGSGRLSLSLSMQAPLDARVEPHRSEDGTGRRWSPPRIRCPCTHLSEITARATGLSEDTRATADGWIVRVHLRRTWWHCSSRAAAWRTVEPERVAE